MIKQLEHAALSVAIADSVDAWLAKNSLPIAPLRALDSEITRVLVTRVDRNQRRGGVPMNATSVVASIVASVDAASHRHQSGI